jgi:hypothetical protein
MNLFFLLINQRSVLIYINLIILFSLLNFTRNYIKVKNFFSFFMFFCIIFVFYFIFKIFYS